MKSDRKKEQGIESKRVVSEYRPTDKDKSVDDAARILRDDIYKLRNLTSKQIVREPRKVKVANTTIISNVFNPGGGRPIFGATPSYIIGVHVFPFGDVYQFAGAMNLSGANVVPLAMFYLPFDIIIESVTYDFVGPGFLDANRKICFGWYDEDGNLAWTTGATTASGIAVKTITISPILILMHGLVMLLLHRSLR
jgi:hypothetical protein